MASKLKNFVDNVFSINPASASVLIPGSGSGSYGATGIDVLNELRRSTARFAELTANHGANAELSELAASIEGSIMTLQILNEISAQRADELLQDLRSLTSS